MKLTEPQIRALKHLAKYPNEWRHDTPTTQKCLNKLSEKGLIKIAADVSKPYWEEMITEKGLKMINEVIDHE